MKSSYMDGQWVIDVDAAGNVVVRARGAKRRDGLPVFATDTEAQASFLVVRHCRLARDGSGVYTLNEPPRTVSDLPRVADMFAATRDAMIARGKWDDLR